MTQGEIIGVSLGQNLSFRDLLQCASTSELHKIDSIWLPEAREIDATVMLSSMAAMTNRIKLGSAILNVFSRSPTQLAMAAATLDTASAGRFILGLGTSTPEIAEKWHGSEFKNSMARTEDYVNIIRQILRGDVVNYVGKTTSIQNFRLTTGSPRPQAPIYIAALGPKMTSLAGRLADGVLLFLRPLSAVKNTVIAVRESAKASSRDPHSVKIACVIVTCIADDEEVAAERARRVIAFYAGVGRFYNKMLAMNGFPEEAELIWNAWQSGNHTEARKQVSDKLLGAVAITGPPSKARQKLAAYRREGVDLPIIQFNSANNDPVESLKFTLGSLLR